MKNQINKYAKLSKKEMNKIIQEYISPITYLGIGFTIKEEFKQCYVCNTFTPLIVSSLGRVFNLYYAGTKYLNVKEMKGSYKSDSGYNKITTSLKGKSYTFGVHVLVALAFVKNPDPINKTQVNHKDGNKRNNIYTNLEWVTPSENAIHAENNGLRVHPTGTLHASNKYSEATINDICMYIEGNKYTIPQIADLTGVSPQMVKNIYIGRAWRTISEHYDFSKYDKIAKITKAYKENRENQIRNVCELISDGVYTMPEISKKTGISYKLVNAIYNKSKYKNIVKDYDFSNAKILNKS